MANKRNSNRSPIANRMQSDPVGSFSFWVELDGLVVGGFSEVSGLDSEVEVEEIREGGLNDYVHVLPRGIRYSNIVLKRGITHSDSLWNWYKQVTTGVVERKNGSIILMNPQGNELWRWEFTGGYPIKWTGPELSSISDSVAIETIEITHQGLKSSPGS